MYQNATTTVEITEPSSNITSGGTQILFNQTSTNTYNPGIGNISFVSTFNSSDIIYASSWVSVNSTFTNVSVYMKAGQYKMVVNSTDGSFYSCNDLVNVTLDTSYIASNKVVSFAGGLFSIDSAGISSSSYILVNGLRGNLLHTSSSLNYYQIPPLITPTISNTFNWI